MNPIEMFAQYVKEREDKEVLICDEGFATYAFGPDYCYIEDIFVGEKFRDSGIAKRMADEIALRAKAHEIRSLVGSVDITAKGSTTSMKVLLAYGMKLSHINGNVIYLKKEI